MSATLDKFDWDTPISIPAVKFSGAVPQPERSAEYENILLQHLFHNEVVWSPSRPRVCVKYPDGYTFRQHTDYDKVEMLPEGTRLFLPADPNEDYDIVSSIMVEAVDNKHRVEAIAQGEVLRPSSRHTILMDVDGWLQCFTLKAHTEEDDTRYPVVYDMFTTDREGVSFATSLYDQQDRLMKRPRCFAHVFGSGSMNLHVYVHDDAGFLPLCRLMDGINSGWTYFARQMGFFSLRAPWKPKPHQDRRYRDRVPPFNWSLRALYATHQNPVGFLAKPHLMGWEYTLDKPAYWKDIETGVTFRPYTYDGVTLAERASRFGLFDKKPADPLVTKVRAMMLEEANRIRNKIGG